LEDFVLFKNYDYVHLGEDNYLIDYYCAWQVLRTSSEEQPGCEAVAGSSQTKHRINGAERAAVGTGEQILRRTEQTAEGSGRALSRTAGPASHVRLQTQRRTRQHPLKQLQPLLTIVYNQARREPQRGPGKYSRRAHLRKKFLNFYLRQWNKM